MGLALRGLCSVRRPAAPHRLVCKPVAQRTNRSRSSSPVYSGDLKFRIGDRAHKTAVTDLVPTVSNLRARKDPRNAGLRAVPSEVSAFGKYVADDIASANRSGPAEFPANREKNREFVGFGPRLAENVSGIIVVSDRYARIP